jgi:hypothetical protein
MVYWSLLTPWSRVLLEKLTGFQLVKKFPAFYGTRRFITAHTSARSEAYSLFRNTIRFYGEDLSAPRPTKLKDHPLSAVRGCLFNIFTATLHTVGRSSVRNVRTRHAVVTGTRLSRIKARLYTETSATVYRSTWCHSPQNMDRHQHR